MPAHGAKRTRSEKDTEVHAQKIPDLFAVEPTNMFSHPMPVTQQNQKHAKSAAAHGALRGAKRAREFVNTISGVYISSSPIDEVKKQLDEIDKDKNADNIEEYDDIIKSLKVFEMQCKNKFAGEVNTTGTFCCAICFVNRPIKTLRLLVPCGHGFCDTCTSRLTENTCPNCRGLIASIFKAYV